MRVDSFIYLPSLAGKILPGKSQFYLAREHKTFFSSFMNENRILHSTQENYEGIQAQELELLSESCLTFFLLLFSHCAFA